MTENSNPEKRPGDIERRDKLRQRLIDALALGMGGFAVFYYKPEGFVAGLIVFVGAYTLTSFLQGLNWRSLAAICEFLLILLAPAIHLGTLAMAPASFTGLVFTFLLPGIAQAYWMWELWPATGALSHPLTVMCAAWLTLLAIWVVAKKVFVDGRTPQEAAN